MKDIKGIERKKQTNLQKRVCYLYNSYYNCYLEAYLYVR